MYFANRSSGNKTKIAEDYSGLLAFLNNGLLDTRTIIHRKLKNLGTARLGE
jgi:hypothetical protein